MDISLKIKALNKLSESTTTDATIALTLELEKSKAIIKSEVNYEILDNNLEIHNVLIDRFPQLVLDSLIFFIESIDNRIISYNAAPALQEKISKYQNSSTLIVKSLTILSRLRYFSTERLVLLLLNLTKHSSEEVKEKAAHCLEEVSAYKINVIHGSGNEQGIGFGPQAIIVSILKSFNTDQLKEYLSPILTIFNELLSASMESISWKSHDSISISKGTLPADEGLAQIRGDSLLLLQKIYKELENSKDKLRVINTINCATSTHGYGRPESFLNLLNRDCIWVLGFYISIGSNEDLPIIQKIEHNGYWIYFHAASSEVEEKAIELERLIALNSEYQIYKTLIGFEGVHINWSLLKKDADRIDSTEQIRSERVIELSKSLNYENYHVWESRIIQYPKVESEDLATFPKFYEFLYLLSNENPELALRLVENNHVELDRFLIPLLKGLTSGRAKDEITLLIKSWVNSNQHLTAISKVFLENQCIDIDLIQAILQKAIETTNTYAISICISVVVTNYEINTQTGNSLIENVFIPAVKSLTVSKSANWIYDFWFKKEAPSFIASMNIEIITLILSNLENLEEINYHCEEILYQISLQFPEDVLAFLALRLAKESDSSTKGNYEAIPYEFYKLNKSLSKIPEKCLSVIFGNYKTNSYLFQYRGARLIRMIFKNIDKLAEDSFIEFMTPLSDDRISFIVGILRNYEGQLFLHGIFKFIIKNTPILSEFWNELAIALQSTGVVSGEFGFVEAYKRKIEEVVDWLSDPNPKVVRFTEWYISGLNSNIALEQASAEEQLALRKHQFL